GLESPPIQQRISSLEDRFKGVKLIVGVDRLDYIKGVPQKLVAFELFLSRHPEWIGRAVLVQVGVPSRQDVEEYKRLRTTVNELVGRINGRFGSVEFMPIHFLHKSVDFNELTALYAVSDACVVSSSRDGMNLVSYEYIACQKKRHGVLILSEFAGAAQSLNGSIIVNPWNIEDLAEAFFEAVTMKDDPRKLNHDKLFRYITKHTAAHWGLSFISELNRVRSEFDPSKLLELPVDKVLESFSSAEKKRVIFLDYDGTLTQQHLLAEYAAPTKALQDSLRRLSEIPNVLVYILSGRSRYYLDKWFGECGVGLSAEHGCFFKHPRKFVEDPGYEPDPDMADYVPSTVAYGPPAAFTPSAADEAVVPIAMELDSSLGRPHPNGPVATGGHAVPPVRAPSATSSTQSAGAAAAAAAAALTLRRADAGWLALVSGVDGSWREVVRPVLRHYADRTPGSFIEEKEVNLTWHFEEADREFAAWQAAELQVNVERLLSHLPVAIVAGPASLELRPSVADKASAARAILRELGGAAGCGFVLCAGDGPTDEPVFEMTETMLAAGAGGDGEAGAEDEVPAAAVTWTACVGKKQTAARYFMRSAPNVVALVEALGATGGASGSAAA
ncbi:Trehalose-6-P synthase/phosphatase complex synthase subunit, partial [Cladochytrium tenue]